MVVVWFGLIWFHDVSCGLTWFVDVCWLCWWFYGEIWRVIGSQVVRLRFFEGGSSWAGLSSLHQLRHGPTGLSRIKRGRERSRYFGANFGELILHFRYFPMQVVENDEKEEGFKSWRSKMIQVHPSARQTRNDTDHVLIVQLGRTSRQMAVERQERRHPERAERQREVSHLR